MPVKYVVQLPSVTRKKRYIKDKKEQTASTLYAKKFADEKEATDYAVKEGYDDYVVVEIK